MAERRKDAYHCLLETLHRRSMRQAAFARSGTMAKAARCGKKRRTVERRVSGVGTTVADKGGERSEG